MISNVLPHTDGLGLLKTLPNAANVEQVQIFTNDMTMYRGNGVTVLSDPKNIELALTAARGYIKDNVKRSYVSRQAMGDRYRATKKGEAFDNVELTFTLKNGTHVQRNYVVRSDKLDPIYI